MIIPFGPDAPFLPLGPSGPSFPGAPLVLVVQYHLLAQQVRPYHLHRCFPENKEFCYVTIKNCQKLKRALARSSYLSN